MAKKEVNEIIRPIILTDNETGTEYTLEFNRDSVRWAESRGFSVDDIERYPLTKIYEFFYYAFRMHHMNISREKTDKILDSWGGIQHLPDGLLERLAQLYTKPFATLSDKEAEEAAKNGRVTVTM